MKKIHLPTTEDIERIKPKPDMLKVSGDGVFATLQGEGITAGLPAVFLRLHYCNLSCGASSGWKCDTGYTWDRTRKEFWREAEDWGYEETAFKITTAWDSKFKSGDGLKRRLVITGGEPLLQQRKIVKLLTHLTGWDIEIETNGTIAPISELHNRQFNCSPKLENSGNPIQIRYQPHVLRKINLLPNSWFKFVVVRPSDLEEIAFMVDDCSLDTDKILVMPEGKTKEEVAKHTEILEPEIKTRDWKLTPRNQLIWFGAKRRT